MPGWHFLLQFLLVYFCLLFASITVYCLLVSFHLVLMNIHAILLFVCLVCNSCLLTLCLLFTFLFISRLLSCLLNYLNCGYFHLLSISYLHLISDHVCHPNPCSNGGICYVKNGAPYCACQDGFVGDKCQSKLIFSLCSVIHLQKL